MFSDLGIATNMGICISHRVVDAASAGAFITAWLNATNPQPGKVPVVPTWDFPSLLPCKGSGANHSELVCNNKTVIKSFVFGKEAIARLREKLSSPEKGKVSRARLVTALIAKALSRLDCAEYAKPRDRVIAQPVDMRRRTTPPLSNRSCGNFALVSLTRCITAHETKTIGIQGLVDILGDAVRRSVAEYAQILSPDGNGYEIVTAALQKKGKELRRGEVKSMSFSDMSKLDFYENGDSGWGRPVWAVYGPMSWPGKVIILMSDREGDGIEARVSLDRNHMQRFQEDRHIKSFATYLENE